MNVLLPILIGAIMGSYWPDLDATKSKASQIINKIILVLVVLIMMAKYLNIEIINSLLSKSSDSLLANTSGLLFIALTILGKLSPHRGFTHKWIGTTLFIVTAFMCFKAQMAFGFMTGYIMHIVADRLTRAGKHLDFFSVRLPMQNSKGKISINW